MGDLWVEMCLTMNRALTFYVDVDNKSLGIRLLHQRTPELPGVPRIDKNSLGIRLLHQRTPELPGVTRIDKNSLGIRLLHQRTPELPVVTRIDKNSLSIRRLHQGTPALPGVPVRLTVQQAIVESGKMVVYHDVHPVPEPPQLEAETAWNTRGIRIITTLGEAKMFCGR